MEVNPMPLGDVADRLGSIAGGFTITGRGGRALLRALDSLHDRLLDAQARAQTLGVQPPLGTTPAAEVYRPFLATIAADADQGLIPALRSLVAEVEHVRSTIAAAIKSYEDSESAAADSVTSRSA